MASSCSFSPPSFIFGHIPEEKVQRKKLRITRHSQSFPSVDVYSIRAKQDFDYESSKDISRGLCDFIPRGYSCVVHSEHNTVQCWLRGLPKFGYPNKRSTYDAPHLLSEKIARVEFSEKKNGACMHIAAYSTPTHNMWVVGSKNVKVVIPDPFNEEHFHSTPTFEDLSGDSKSFFDFVNKFINPSTSKESHDVLRAVCMISEQIPTTSHMALHACFLWVYALLRMGKASSKQLHSFMDRTYTLVAELMLPFLPHIFEVDEYGICLVACTESAPYDPEDWGKRSAACMPSQLEPLLLSQTKLDCFPYPVSTANVVYTIQPPSPCLFNNEDLKAEWNQVINQFARFSRNEGVVAYVGYEGDEMRPRSFFKEKSLFYSVARKIRNNFSEYIQSVMNKSRPIDAKRPSFTKMEILIAEFKPSKQESTEEVLKNWNICQRLLRGFVVWIISDIGQKHIQSICTLVHQRVNWAPPCNNTVFGFLFTEYLNLIKQVSETELNNMNMEMDVMVKDEAVSQDFGILFILAAPCPSLGKSSFLTEKIRSSFKKGTRILHISQDKVGGNRRAFLNRIKNASDPEKENYQIIIADKNHTQEYQRSQTSEQVPRSWIRILIVLAATQEESEYMAGKTSFPNTSSGAAASSPNTALGGEFRESIWMGMKNLIRRGPFHESLYPNPIQMQILHNFAKDVTRISKEEQGRYDHIMCVSREEGAPNFVRNIYFICHGHKHLFNLVLPIETISMNTYDNLALGKSDRYSDTYVNTWPHRLQKMLQQCDPKIEQLVSKLKCSFYGLELSPTSINTLLEIPEVMEAILKVSPKNSLKKSFHVTLKHPEQEQELAGTLVEHADKTLNIGHFCPIEVIEVRWIPGQIAAVRVRLMKENPVYQPPNYVYHITLSCGNKNILPQYSKILFQTREYQETNRELDMEQMIVQEITPPRILEENMYCLYFNTKNMRSIGRKIVTFNNEQ